MFLAALLRYLAKPETLRFASKLGSVWIVAFFAASGGIWARRWHKEPDQVRPSWAERRKAWNGPTRRGR